jgi:5-methyltetrahydropteroyltriglutamate--homocysteine methyltransferase
LFLSSFERFKLAAKEAKIIVAFYFGDLNKLYKQLPEIPADMMGIDFTYSPGLEAKLLVDGFERPIAFGVLDGRNTKMEDPQEIARNLQPILERLNVTDCHITTSCGLEYLPKQYAIRKLEITAEVARLVNGESK